MLIKLGALDVSIHAPVRRRLAVFNIKHLVPVFQSTPP